MTGRTAVPAGVDGAASATGRAIPPLPRVPAGLPTRERRPGYVALAVVLIVGLAALGGYFYTRAEAKTPVVVVVRDIPAGHTISRADLSTVAVAGAVTAIGGPRLDSVVGQTAAVELLPNTLLQRAMISATPGLAAGQARVGVQVRPGQIPADGLNPGDTVQILQLPAKDATTSTGSTGTSATVLASKALVYSTTADPSAAGGTLLTVLVPTKAAEGIAAASNAGLVALVQVAP